MSELMGHTIRSLNPIYKAALSFIAKALNPKCCNPKDNVLAIKKL